MNEEEHAGYYPLVITVNRPMLTQVTTLLCFAIFTKIDFTRLGGHDAEGGNYEKNEHCGRTECEFGEPDPVGSLPILLRLANASCTAPDTHGISS